MCYGYTRKRYKLQLRHNYDFALLMRLIWSSRARSRVRIRRDSCFMFCSRYASATSSFLSAVCCTLSDLICSSKWRISLCNVSRFRFSRRFRASNLRFVSQACTRRSWDMRERSNWIVIRSSEIQSGRQVLGSMPEDTRNPPEVFQMLRAVYWTASISDFNGPDCPHAESVPILSKTTAATKPASDKTCTVRSWSYTHRINSKETAKAKKTYIDIKSRRLRDISVFKSTTNPIRANDIAHQGHSGSSRGKLISNGYILRLFYSVYSWESYSTSNHERYEPCDFAYTNVGLTLSLHDILCTICTRTISYSDSVTSRIRRRAVLMSLCISSILWMCHSKRFIFSHEYIESWGVSFTADVWLSSWNWFNLYISIPCRRSCAVAAVSDFERFMRLSA